MWTRTHLIMFVLHGDTSVVRGSQENYCIMENRRYMYLWIWKLINGLWYRDKKPFFQVFSEFSNWNKVQYCSEVTYIVYVSGTLEKISSETRDNLDTNQQNEPYNWLEKTNNRLTKNWPIRRYMDRNQPMTDDKLFKSLLANTIMAKLTNQFQ